MTHAGGIMAKEAACALRGGAAGTLSVGETFTTGRGDDWRIFEIRTRSTRNGSSRGSTACSPSSRRGRLSCHLQTPLRGRTSNETIRTSAVPALWGVAAWAGMCGTKGVAYDKGEARGCAFVRHVCAGDLVGAGGVRGRGRRPWKQQRVPGPPATAPAERRLRPLTA
jgi:hypothetical protein